jgi:acyl-CoA synthetase (NDP forming)
MSAAPPPDAMRCLMAPRAVAVFGATERPGAASGFVIRNLLAAGFAGAILPVNPTGRAVFDLPAIPRLADLETRPDAVVIAVAAERVAEALRDAAALRIPAAVILASGFAETGAAGRQRQDEIAAIACGAGMAVCGPNCLGLVNMATGAALFSSRLSPTMRAGAVALLSHSGAAAITLANSGRLAVGHLVSAGNAATTDLAAYLAYCADAPEIRVAALFMEQLRDPQAFAAAVDAMHAAGKPVVALRVGRSSRAARVTAAHTGGVAGSDAAFGAFFRRIGVIEVADFDALAETATLLAARMPRAAGRRVGFVAVSGGSAAHVCDIADIAGLEVPALGETTVAALRTILPPYATAQNPLDVTGIAFGDATIHGRALDLLAADPAIDIVAAIQDVPAALDATGAGEYAGIAESFASFAARTRKPAVFVANLAAGIHPDIAALLQARGATQLQGTTAALHALGHLAAPLRRARPRSATTLTPQDAWRSRLARGGALSERESKLFLAAHGMPVTRDAAAGTLDAALAAAEAIGYPVALKIDSPDLPHKTDVGGVRLGLVDAAALRAAHADMLARVRDAAPGARIDGVLVQEMIGGGVEMLLGMTRHAPFGPVIALAAGGTLVELLQDTALGLLPLDAEDATDMVGAMRVAALLDGWRGSPARDRPALIDLILRFAALVDAYAPLLDAIDLNPVSVGAAGVGVRILDALVVARAPVG